MPVITTYSSSGSSYISSSANRYSKSSYSDRKYYPSFSSGYNTSSSSGFYRKSSNRYDLPLSSYSSPKTYSREDREGSSSYRTASGITSSSSGNNTSSKNTNTYSNSSSCNASSRYTSGYGGYGTLASSALSRDYSHTRPSLGTSSSNNYVSNIRNTALCGAELYQRYSLSTFKPALSIVERAAQAATAAATPASYSSNCSTGLDSLKGSSPIVSTLETGESKKPTNTGPSSRNKATIKLRPVPSTRSAANASTATTATFTGVVSNGPAAGVIATGLVDAPTNQAKVVTSLNEDDLCEKSGTSTGVQTDGNFHVTATIRIKPKDVSTSSSSSNSISSSNISNSTGGGHIAMHNGTATHLKNRTSGSDSNISIIKNGDDEQCNQHNNNLHVSNNGNNIDGILSNGNSSNNINNINNNIKSYNEYSASCRAGGCAGVSTSMATILSNIGEVKPKDNEDDDDGDRVSYLQSDVGSKELGSSLGSYRVNKDYDLYRHSSAVTSVLPKSNYDNNYDVTDSVRTRKDGLCGLWNVGNTCFMNSIIQCLSHTRELTSFLRSQPSTERGTGKDHRILVEYTKLIQDMWSGTQRSVNPSELKYAFSSKHRMYSGSAQQDAQEFLRFFLDSLHGALNVAVKRDALGELDDDMNNRVKADMLWEWYSKAENSMIKDLFVGQLRSTLKCTYCNTESTMFDPFWDLSLPMPSSNSRCQLENCLEMFIKEEIMDGIDQPTCSKCNTRRKCTKSLTIERFPKYLVIHLKRFSETRWSKLTNVIDFPCAERGLNLQPYASEDNVGPAFYSLYGISNHMGSTAGGHYVAVCKHPKTKEWHEFNDNFVSETSDRSLVTSSAYVLFYERA